VVIFEVKADIDQFLGSGIYREFANLLAAGRRKFVIDLRSVTSILSAGLGYLILCEQETSRRRGQVGFCGVKPEILQFFQFASVGQFFHVYPNVISIPWNVDPNPEAGS